MRVVWLALLVLLAYEGMRYASKPGGTVAWGSASSQGARRYQEDRVLVDGDIGLFAVFDGHIGNQASQFLASSFKSELVEQLAMDHSSVPKEKHMSDSLSRALVALDRRFLDRAQQHGTPAGSTACVAMVNQDHVAVANVGDSRAMLCKAQKDGRVMHKPLTKDHHPEDEHERKRIEAAGGVISKGVINGHFPMSRAIGDLPMRRYGVVGWPTSTLAKRKAGDHLVIVSDGILEGMGEQEICNMVQEQVTAGADYQAIAQAILNKASWLSTDNLSIVVVSL